MYLESAEQQQALRKEIHRYFGDLFVPELGAQLDRDPDEARGSASRPVAGKMVSDGRRRSGWHKEHDGQGRAAIEEFIPRAEGYRTGIRLPTQCSVTSSPWRARGPRAGSMVNAGEPVPFADECNGVGCGRKAPRRIGRALAAGATQEA